MQLLTRHNYKLKKSERVTGGAWRIRGMWLAPTTIGGHDVCTKATAACKAACLAWMSGRNMAPAARTAKLAKKRWLFSDPAAFHQQLKQELLQHIRTSSRTGRIPGARLNLGSDWDWSDIYRDLPELRGWDYTKHEERMFDPGWPDNYSLTFSASERSPVVLLRHLLAKGRNVAVVFSTRYRPIQDPLPNEWKLGRKWYQVVDGDLHDIRRPEFDGRGVIVGLRFKGGSALRERAIRGGFCVRV